MQVGDLIELESKRWIVVSFDRTSQVGLVVDQDGTRRELANDMEGLNIVANPSKEWPLLVGPTRPGAGPFVKLSVPSLPGRPNRVLEPWSLWIQSDPVRDGGGIFIHPSVRLLTGDVLLAEHKSGTIVRIQVPRTFATTAQRVARATRPPPEPINRFSRMLDDDE